jgi:hypothetical protein
MSLLLSFLQIAVALPPPYTAETVNEWAESFFDSFLAEETANRIKAEEEAAVREAKRLKERNAAKVKTYYHCRIR